MNETTTSNMPPPPPPPPLAGLGVAGTLVAAIIGWFALAGSFLSEPSLFAGLMIIWYWAKLEHLAIQRLVPTVLGSLVGIALAWGIYYGSTHHGGIGLAVGLLLLILAIYLDIIQVAPQFFNAATMLFSIVAGAPLIQLKINWLDLCLATIGGGLYFGAFVAAVTWLAQKMSNAKRTENLI